MVLGHTSLTEMKYHTFACPKVFVGPLVFLI